LGRGDQARAFLGGAIFLGPVFPPKTIPLWIPLTIAGNTNEGEDPAAVFRVSLHGSTGEFSISKNYEVVAFTVSTIGGAGGATCRDFGSGQADLFEAVGIEVRLGHRGA
jgi:hypothetical protein